MKNKQKGNALVIVLLIIAIVIVGGWLYYSKNKPEPTQVNSISINSASSTSAIQTTDWKTYTDAENGFSFKYPAQFTPDINNNYPASGDVLVTLRRPSYGDWSFSVSGDYNHQSFEDAVKDYPFRDEKDFQQKTIIVSGKNAQEFSHTIGAVPMVSVYIHKNDGEYIAINWKSAEDVSKDKTIQNSKDEFYALLSTFKLSK